MYSLQIHIHVLKLTLHDLHQFSLVLSHQLQKALELAVSREKMNSTCIRHFNKYSEKPIFM